MLLLLLIALGEFFSSPALALADAATLNATKDNPQEVSGACMVNGRVVG